VNIFDVDRDLYEVVVKNECTGRTRRHDLSYKISLTEGSRAKYKCRKPQNGSVVTRNFDPNQFT
jgi:hypothetical protein